METDDDLVERSRRGDEAAFEALCAQHEARIRQLVERKMPGRLRKRISVSDVLQETYLTAHQRLGEFRGAHDGSFGAWLHGIAQFKLKEAARHHLDTGKRAADRELSRHQRAESHAFRGREATPSLHAMASETKAVIDEAMAALPADYRRILVLVHESGLSTSEAAEQLGRSAEAARKLYGRAVSRLAEEMEKGRG